MTLDTILHCGHGGGTWYTRAKRTSGSTEAEVLARLDRIRFSTEFDAPERARQFLAYVVRERLQAVPIV